jgi:phosphate starvation-inducible PhoH-like protein
LLTTKKEGKLETHRGNTVNNKTRKKTPMTTKKTAVQKREETIANSEHTHRHQPVMSNTLKIKLDHLRTFEALTENQQKFFDNYNRGDYNIALHGVAGTGKTFCALYKALGEVLDKNNPFRKVIVVRSAVQSREIGHLPGDEEEKMDIYQMPYRQICETLFDRKDAWERLTEQGFVEFISTSFIRGLSFDDAIVIVDEMQNMTFEEIDTVMTRVGYRSKIIWCGDYRQTDLNKKKSDMSGILKFFEIAAYMNSFTRIEFGIDDIVRSSIIKEYIIAKLKEEESHDAKQTKKGNGHDNPFVGFPYTMEGMRGITSGPLQNPR